MRLQDLVQARVRALRSLDTAPLAACLSQMSPRERVPGVMLLSGRLPDGPIGLSVGRLHEFIRRHALHREGAGLSLLHAIEGLRAVRGRRGMGAEKRLARARELFEVATRDESDFLIKLVANQLRAPTFDRLLVEAIATTGDLDPALVWQAVQCSHDFAATAKAAFGSGEAGLEALVAETRPGTRRDPELESMVMEAPENADVAAVYGDWLLQNGQPHGALVAAAVVPVRAEQRKRAWSKALKRFARQEGLGTELYERLLDPAVATWRHGFLRRLWIPGQTLFAPDLAEAVLRLLAGSAAALLETLALDIDEVVPLHRVPTLPSLARLRLDLHPTAGRLQLTVLRQHTRLRHLQLEGSLPLHDRDLSGVHDLELSRLDLKGTYDLAPLAGAPLETIVLASANHVGLGPLASLPRLRVLGWGQNRSPDVRALAGIPTLKAIHLRDRPSVELRQWAERRGVALLRYATLLERT
ncbi:MAG: hypothetical protein AAGA48_40485 [Myxococcota bacterium]